MFSLEDGKCRTVAQMPIFMMFTLLTTIEFSIPQSGSVTVTVYDILGREAETILNKQMDAGHHKLQWNASNVPSGIYFVRMQSGNFNQVRKISVLR